MGTILRSGEQLRVTAQLVETPGGTLLTSHAVMSSLGDLFHLQDQIARRVVDALSLPLHGQPSTPDAPQDARAYSLYLQANAIASDYDKLTDAVKLYEQCVELDPGFAPGWAQLGRAYRVVGKFLGGPDDSEARAEAALRRALEINPRLSLAHKQYAMLESDQGHALGALSRLLDEANRHGNDPELFAGLVHACRYCGLYDQSIAAHMEARRLDPKIPTGVEGTLMMNGELERTVTSDPTAGEDSSQTVGRVIALGSVGKRDEALKLLRSLPMEKQVPVFHVYVDFMRAWLERKPEEMAEGRAKMAGLKVLDDPEAMFQEGSMYCSAGDPVRGLEMLRRSVAKGFFPPQKLARSAMFAEVRGMPEFQKILADSEAGRAQAMVVFRQHSGEQLLGRTPASVAA
jgi:tetratricopeptide (TPR) repeat protein